MHHLTHMSGHMGCHNIQMSQAHNPSTGFAPNQNFTTNIGNANGPRVVQYNRVSQMETKSNQRINNFQNMRQQHQPMLKKTQIYQHHTHANINFQQKNVNQRDQPLNAENKLSHQLHLQKLDVPPKSDNSSLRLKKREKIKNNDSNRITQKIKTFQFLNSADSSSKEPKPNFFIKKREIISKIPINDNAKDVTSIEVSSGKLMNASSPNVSLNNIEKLAIMSTAGSTFEQPDSKSYTNKEEQYTNEESYKQNKTDQELNTTYDKTIEDDESTDNSNQPPIKTIREKTPMCLINDLARFNKISFQYRLTSENGPAHCKQFTVTLKLGDEEYTAEEFKIKKAQHLAAKEAIEKTKYKHPVPKTLRRSDDHSVMRTNITPTVELNALAMKLGQQTYYIFDPRLMSLSESTSQLNLRTTKSNNSNVHLMSPRSVMINRDHNKMLRSGNLSGTFLPNLVHSEPSKRGQKSDEQRQLPKIRFPTFQHSLQNGIVQNPLVSSYFPSSSPCRITLIVGTQKFVGIGRTLQQAKHDAASNALKVLKDQISTQENQENDESFDENDIKSPISLVFEIGIKRNLPVDFKVLREEGPAHMRSFTTACIVGHILTEGEGTGKKISKKKAAQKMLDELKKLPPLTTIPPPLKRIKLKTTTKICGTSCVNIATSTEEEQQRTWNINKKHFRDIEAANPITKLIEWHQQNKEKEPIFKLISEIGKENSRRRQFVMEVSSNKAVARGIGNSKKNAKRDAAQNFLLAIGSAPENQKMTETNNVACMEDTSSNSDVNQSQNKLAKSNQVEDVSESIVIVQFNKGLDISNSNDDKVDQIQTNEIEKSFEKLGSNEGESADNSARSIERNDEAQTTTTSEKSSGLYMKDHLLYLAKLLGFEVDFSDYPKGNHNEFLTIVMLSTNPPQICHGVGVNAKESQDDAAKNALKILSEMGLNNAVKF